MRIRFFAYLLVFDVNRFIFAAFWGIGPQKGV